MKQPVPSLYEWLAALFVTVLIVSNIASVKVVTVSWVVFDAGTILFPLSYIIGDVITEVYGYRRMRSLLIRSVAMLLLTSLTFWIVGLLPASADWALQTQFNDILGVVWRIVAASIIAIFIGELANAYIMAKLKLANRDKRLWHRIIGSSAVGDALDTVLFSTIAFAGTMPLATLGQLIVSVYIMKMVVETALSPLTIRLITHIKRHEQVDVYETPFVLSTPKRR